MRQCSRRRITIRARGPGVAAQATAHLVVVNASMRSPASAYCMFNRDAAPASVLPVRRPPAGTAEAMNSRATLPPRDAGGKWPIGAAEHRTEAEAGQAAADAALVPIADALVASAPDVAPGGGVAAARAAVNAEQAVAGVEAGRLGVQVVAVGGGEVGGASSSATPCKSSARRRAFLLRAVAREPAMLQPKVEDRDHAVAAAAMPTGSRIRHRQSQY